ncbi:MAG: TasA family protein [Clostridia bacterium]
MAVAMVAMLAFGGTYAYFTATATTGVSGQTIKTGVIQLKVDDSITSVFSTNVGNLLPGDALFDDGLTLSTAGSTAESYVAIKVTISGAITGLSIELATTDGTWVESAEDSNIYVLAASTGTGATAASAVAADDTVAVYAAGATLATTPDYDNNNGDLADGVMGATMTITVEARSIQVRNFNDGAATVAQVAEKLFA